MTILTALSPGSRANRAWTARPYPSCRAPPCYRCSSPAAYLQTGFPVSAASAASRLSYGRELRHSCHVRHSRWERDPRASLRAGSSLHFRGNENTRCQDFRCDLSPSEISFLLCSLLRFRLGPLVFGEPFHLGMAMGLIRLREAFDLIPVHLRW